MLDDIHTYTLGVILSFMLGDYSQDEHVLESTVQLMSVIGKGMLAIPFRFPWPLNMFPGLQFGKSMDAREQLDDIFRGESMTARRVGGNRREMPNRNACRLRQVCT